MSKPQDNKKMKQEEPDSNLRGTLISVSLLGLFLLVTWFGVWSVFLSR